MAGSRLFYIGSYTGKDGDGDGITTYRQDPATGVLTPTGEVTVADNPSFLALSPAGDRLYAVVELDEGGLAGYGLDGSGGLSLLGRRPTGGALPCHLSVTPSGRYLLAANYGSGSVSVHGVGPDGAPQGRADLVQHAGTGPDPDRQAGPHAHQAVLDPTGWHVLTVDLGTDEIRTYRLDPDTGALQSGPVGRTEPGAGPRHVAFHPDGRVLVCDELGSTVTEFDYQPNTGVLTRRRTVAALAGTADERNYPAEIAVGPGGRFTYVSNRGGDCVTVLATGDGALEAVVDVPSGGRWPRHLVIVEGWLYVANQNSHSVAAFRIDAQSGGLDPGPVLKVPSPACVLPAAT